MDHVYKFLRRLTPRTIASLGTVVTVGVLLLFVFGLAPLAFTLLLPYGEGFASVISLVFSIGGSIWTLLKVPPVFIEAYRMRQFDDALYEVVAAVRKMFGEEETADGGR